MDYEAERLEQRIDMVTDETLDATRRIRQVAEETNQVGIDTLVTLNEQGEQLDNVENRLDTIGADLHGNEYNCIHDVIWFIIFFKKQKLTAIFMKLRNVVVVVCVHGIE